MTLEYFTLIVVYGRTYISKREKERERRERERDSVCPPYK